MSILLHPERLGSVHPDLARFAHLVAAKSPHDWCVVTGTRTLQGVLEKWEVGRTRPGPHAGEPGYPPLGLTVTQVRTLEGAPHAVRVTPLGLYGCAVDLQYLLPGGHLAPGDGPEQQRVYQWLGALAEGEGLVWGGRFHRVDQAHIEHPLWRTFKLPIQGIS